MNRQRWITFASVLVVGASGLARPAAATTAPAVPECNGWTFFYLDVCPGDPGINTSDCEALMPHCYIFGAVCANDQLACYAEAP